MDYYHPKISQNPNRLVSSPNQASTNNGLGHSAHIASRCALTWVTEAPALEIYKTGGFTATLSPWVLCPGSGKSRYNACAGEAFPTHGAFRVSQIQSNSEVSGLHRKKPAVFRGVSCEKNWQLKWQDMMVQQEHRLHPSSVCSRLCCVHKQGCLIMFTQNMSYYIVAFENVGTLFHPYQIWQSLDDNFGSVMTLIHFQAELSSHTLQQRVGPVWLTTNSKKRSLFMCIYIYTYVYI